MKKKRSITRQKAPPRLMVWGEEKGIPFRRIFRSRIGVDKLLDNPNVVMFAVHPVH